MGEGGEGGGAGGGDDGAGGRKEKMRRRRGSVANFKWHMTKDSTVLIGSKMTLIFWSSNETDKFFFLLIPFSLNRLICMYINI